MTKETPKSVIIPQNLNPDALTGEIGSHPVGTGIGAASTATAATLVGAVLGGPVGALTGAVIGSVAGGYLGKEVAEFANPTVVDAYWSVNFSSRPYISKDARYDYYRPAYQFGYEQRGKFPNKKFAEIESDLSKNWQSSSRTAAPKWEEAKEAVRDSYELDAGFYNVEGNQQVKPRNNAA